ncbi:MAPEG family protein [Aestuariibacter halophilus]|uniref:MAPEG family protein n=1 Tax=Fluctibacter halophilus TaxID=226011 RepID=A0ABS8GCH1_9ALTE|nr:MAPEG family protein [Aestuariibacter halophilus]MCC2618272.1 MAPEG family protein [Aestuariibacter halophilus]
MNASILALTGFIAWTIFLLVWLGSYRLSMVMRRQKAPNSFKADGTDVTDFGYRLTRAYSNCVESFAFIGGALLLALATSSASITDPLALWLLAARLGQSVTHLISISNRAVQIRFAFFIAQVAIVLVWVFQFYQQFGG